MVHDIWSTINQCCKTVFSSIKLIVLEQDLIVKDVVSFQGLGQLIDVACNCMCYRDLQTNSKKLLVVYIELETVSTS